MSSSSKDVFGREGVADYERRRYRGLDQRLVDGRERRILRRFFRRLTSERPSPLVLDTPCGYGRFSGLVLEAGASLVSADLSQSMVARTLGRLPASSGPESGTRIGGEARRLAAGVVADLKGGLPFKTGSFDYILSVRFFHHLERAEDRKAVLAGFARVASQGAVVSFYQATPVHALQRRLRRALGKGKYEVRMISPGEFELEAEAAGWHVIEVIPLFRGLHAQRIALLMKTTG